MQWMNAVVDQSIWQTKMSRRRQRQQRYTARDFFFLFQMHRCAIDFTQVTPVSSKVSSGGRS